MAELLSPGFDPVRQANSQLAPVDAPTPLVKTVMVVLTDDCHLVTAVFAPGLWLPSRIALGLAGVALFAVTV